MSGLFLCIYPSKTLNEGERAALIDEFSESFTIPPKDVEERIEGVIRASNSLATEME